MCVCVYIYVCVSVCVCACSVNQLSDEQCRFQEDRVCVYWIFAEEKGPIHCFYGSGEGI